MALEQQVCSIHPEREAVARCPGCHRYFSREYVAEHEGKMLCTFCLDKLVGSEKKTTGSWASMTLTMLVGAAGVMSMCLIFILVGHVLSSLPDSFHTGIQKEEYAEKKEAQE